MRIRIGSCILSLSLLGVLLGDAPLPAEDAEEASRLTLERIYKSEEFDGDGISARWLDDSSGYTTLESATGPSGGRDIVRHDPGTGEREVLVPAEHLVPPGESRPLAVDAYDWSADRSLLIVYTNSKRVWRRKTRGDYWVLDRSSRELRKLGGDAKPSTLMFAKLSPTGRQAAYVRENDIYVEDLRGGEITRLTTSGSGQLINGTFD
ncbi:MAG: DPP IV N-terminal domain-containing protein, partial [Planctomycetota bacterium]|nr:DPP IV N-terminal domain-containing protein [Planctomycetota bacterium]